MDQILLGRVFKALIVYFLTNVGRDYIILLYCCVEFMYGADVQCLFLS